MVHPLVPPIQALADPVAQSLDLEVVQVVFQTNQYPPVLRIDIRPLDPTLETSHAHCEAFSRALEPQLDEADWVPGNYVLEISSPGVDRWLTSDRDFTVFKGFPVEVTTDPPHKGKVSWQGNLVSREAERLTLSQKGRSIHIPLECIRQVELIQTHEE